MTVTINPPIIYAIVGTFLALSAGSVVRLLLVRNAAPEIARARQDSLKTWWVLAALLSIAVLFGMLGTAVLLAVASGLGLREYLRLIGDADVGFVATAGAFGLIPVHYGLIAIGYDVAAHGLLPAAALLLIGSVRSGGGRVRNYIRSTGAVVWGILLLVYAPSHALFLFRLPVSHEPFVGLEGWFLFLIILTESSDIAQAIIGRRFGRHKMAPVVSPNKSWEGFVGGLAVTTGLSMVLARWLTTLQHGRSTVDGMLVSSAAGVLIMVSGFFGDINMSAVKRDAGVKDGSALLPGHGGVIDRIDSLSFSAPVFYYFVLAVRL